MIIIAHRGCSGTALENSRDAFQKAIELGADLVELDVQRTQDGVLIVMHDDKLDRCSNGSGPISAQTYSYLAKNVKLNNGEHVLTFDEACAMIAAAESRVVVEMKQEGLFEDVLATLNHYMQPDHYLLASGFTGQLRRAKLLNPGIKTCAIFDTLPEKWMATLDICHADFVALNFEHTSNEQIQSIRESGREVYLWTLNEPDDITRALEMNPDGIVSDYPDRVKEKITVNQV